MNIKVQNYIKVDIKNDRKVTLSEFKISFIISLIACMIHLIIILLTKYICYILKRIHFISQTYSKLIPDSKSQHAIKEIR